MKPKTTQRTIDSFFNTWTPDKAYVLGYFAADGSMYKNKRGSCYISFTSADEEQITLIKNILRVSNQIEIYQPKGNCKLRYTLQVGSKVVYKKFLALGLVPNKSLILTFPKIPDILLRHFTRGYFDGDGCAYYGISIRKDPKRAGQVIKHVQVNIRCGSEAFLMALQILLTEQAKLGKGSLYKHTSAYSLAYSGRDVILLYSFMYPSLDMPFLRRKRQVLKEGLKTIGIEV